MEHITADVFAATRERNFRDRLMSIALACRHHRSFLKRLQQHRMLPPQVDFAVRRQEEGRDSSPQVCALYMVAIEWLLELQVASSDALVLSILPVGLAHTHQSAHMLYRTHDGKLSGPHSTACALRQHDNH